MPDPINCVRNAHNLPLRDDAEKKLVMCEKSFNKSEISITMCLMNEPSFVSSLKLAESNPHGRLNS